MRGAILGERDGVWIVGCPAVVEFKTIRVRLQKPWGILGVQPQSTNPVEKFFPE